MADPSGSGPLVTLVGLRAEDEINDREISCLERGIAHALAAASEHMVADLLGELFEVIDDAVPGP